MPVRSTPTYSPNVANKILEQHGLKGKVTPQGLAEAARKYDTTSKGYISGDEFALAARDLEQLLGSDPASPVPTPTEAPTYSPIFARGADLTRRLAADLADPRLAKAKERILANAGPGARFGELDAGKGLRAFGLDRDSLDRIDNPQLRRKLDELADDRSFVAILSTADEPRLTLAAVNTDEAKVLTTFDLLDPSTAAQLGGDSDPLQAVADLLGDAPRIELGGEDPEWTLANSDWATGGGFTTLKDKQMQRLQARDAALRARAEARDAAMMGPKSVAEFAAMGVVGHRHSAAEKQALLALVQTNAGEDKTFPNPDDSYYGLHTFLLEGPAAAHAVAFAQATGAGPVDLDLDKQSVIVTIKSFDEAQVGTFVIDRDSQKVLLADEANAVDYPEAPVLAFFPDANPDEGLDGHVIGSLAKRGELLGVVAGSDTPDDMDFSDWG